MVACLHCRRGLAQHAIILRVRSEVEGAMSHVPNMTGRKALALRLAGGADRIDRVVAAVGRAVMWLCLFIVLMQFAAVLMRYAFGVGRVWIPESIMYAHAALFLLAAAWTLQQNGHVRVDVFYSRASQRGRAIIDLLGALFLLLPFTAVTLYFALPYAA